MSSSSVPRLEAHLAAHGHAGLTLKLKLRSAIVAHSVQRSLKPLPGVSNIVAVASGKGGVGKSTVAVNLALAWAQAGARVGMLDADIYGPSQPLMLGLEGQRPTAPDGKHLVPLEAHGIKAMSIGFLVDADPGTGLARTDGDAGADAAACATPTGANSTTWWSTCRRAPATSSSRCRSACRSPALSS